jgi:hypothetical protein
MKNVSPCGSCNRRSSETSVVIRATRSNILEEIIFHSHRCENLKFYVEIKMFLGNKARQVSEAYLTAISEPIVYTLWDPQHLTTV